MLICVDLPARRRDLPTVFCLHRWPCSLSRIECLVRFSADFLITSSSSDLAPGKLLVSILLSGLVGFFLGFVFPLLGKLSFLSRPPGELGWIKNEWVPVTLFGVGLRFGKWEVEFGLQLPDESGELPGNGDEDFVLFFASCLEFHIPFVKPVLHPP